MDFTEYQLLCKRTDNGNLNSKELRLLNWCLGIGGESGELLNKMKKKIFHQKSIDVKEIEEEIGDVLWYLAILAYDLNLDFNTVVESNIKKLMIRYPNGFSLERANNRLDKVR